MRPTTLIKRDSGTGVLCTFCKISKSTLFNRDKKKIKKTNSNNRKTKGGTLIIPNCRINCKKIVIEIHSYVETNFCLKKPYHSTSYLPLKTDQIVWCNSVLSFFCNSSWGNIFYIQFFININSRC